MYGHMAADVTIFAALFAGLLSFLSPCVLPLVPAYLVYLAGASLERVANDDAPRVRWQTVGAAALFVAGFSTVFVTLGAAASSVGLGLRAFQSWLAAQLAALKAVSGLGFLQYITDDPLTLIAGIVIIVMGLHFLGVTPIALMYREKRMEVAKPVGLWGAYLMGLAFAFGWTPCIGPILAVILAIAASEATVAKGAGLLAIYSLGLGIPFLAAAFAIERFAKFLARFRAYLPLVEKTMGAMLVLAGFSFLFGWVQSFGTWLLEAFPRLGEIEDLANRIPAFFKQLF
jgi:cytochrome c-type biogenesis protein